MKSIFVTIAVYIALTCAGCLLVNTARAQEYSSGVYTLVCKTSGLALDRAVCYGDKRVDANLQLRLRLGSWDQRGNLRADWPIRLQRTQS